MTIKSFIVACYKFIRDIYVLYKVAFYEFFWAFMYVFVNRNLKDIKNENILITGTGSGIGKNIALKLAAMGNTILCVDIDKNNNDITVSEIIQLGGKAYGFCCNVGVYDEIANLNKQTREKVGKVSYLFNVAGVVSGKPFRELTPDQVRRTINVNILAVVWMTQVFMEDMIELGYGHVTTISSVAGLFGSPKLVDYSCSKFAVMGFMEALRFEVMLLNLPVEFTVVSPFFIQTGMFDGIHTKWPYFMPVLETDYVGDKIIHAVRHNAVICVMPRIFYYLMLVKAFCPDRLSWHVNRFMGTFEVMDHFRGREKTNSESDDQLSS